MSSFSLEGPVTPESIESISQALRDINASRYVTYATFCLIMYDHLLTISEEVNLVWQSRSVNLVKCLFLFNRYAVPICLAVDCAIFSGYMSGLHDHNCRAWLMFDLCIEVISLFSTTLIITLRVRALWTDARKVHQLLNLVWGLHVVGSIGLLINSSVKNIESYSYLPQLNICFGMVQQSWLIWLPAMVFHVVIFIMLIYKSLYTPRRDQTPLMGILLVDGFTYFAILFLAMLANLLIWAIGSPNLAQLPHYSVWALSTLAITRLLLSLQRRFYNAMYPQPGEYPRGNGEPATELSQFPKQPSAGTTTFLGQWDIATRKPPAMNDPDFYAYYANVFGSDVVNVNAPTGA